tara:strand:+ start:1307 stop:3157 length:1851 start_codon:yes stop_codon:yes gene_type:complete
MLRVEIEKRLGAIRNKKGNRFYYDCPHCTVKDPTGSLVVDWGTDKFICNHCDSCGFAGTISKSLGFELGIRTGGESKAFEYKKPEEIKKPVYKVGDIKPKEFKVKYKDDSYVPMNDRARQINALFPVKSDLITCIDSQYGALVSIDSTSLQQTEGNFTHFKVNAGGSKAADIVDYRYTLVECDEIADLKIQGAYIEQLGLPVASLTWSGNKSLHAVIKIEADTHEEYKRRVSLIHEVCDSVGFKIDKTKDCCRFTRLAGSINNKTGKIQKLMEVNTGAKDWNDWELFFLPRLIVTENVMNSSDVQMKDIISGFSSGFATHDYNDSGLKGGVLTLLTGKRNQGKTTFSRQIVIASAIQEIKSFVWYGEGNKEFEKGYFVRLIARDSEIIENDNGFGRVTWKADKNAETRFDEYLGRFIDMYVKPISLPIPVFDDLLSRMTDKVRQGCQLFVIDNMMKLTADQKEVNSAQRNIISKLKEFADHYGVHIILIAHPKKGDGDQSISGAMEQENTADTILRFKRILSADAVKDDRMPMNEKEKVTATVRNEKGRDGATDKIMYMEFDHVRQANIDIAYLPEIQEMAQDYQEGGMFSRPVDDFVKNMNSQSVNGTTQYDKFN